MITQGTQPSPCIAPKTKNSAKRHFRQGDEAQIHLAENITTPCLSSCGGYEGYEGRNCLLSREITYGYQYLPRGYL